MFHDKAWKLVYFEVKRSNVKVTSHKNVRIYNIMGQFALVLPV